MAAAHRSILATTLLLLPLAARGEGEGTPALAPQEKIWPIDLFQHSPPPPPPVGAFGLPTIQMPTLPTLSLFGGDDASPPPPPPSFFDRMKHSLGIIQNPPPPPPEGGFFWVNAEPAARQAGRIHRLASGSMLVSAGLACIAIAALVIAAVKTSRKRILSPEMPATSLV